MLPKIDSPEWINYGIAQKVDILNEVLQEFLAKETQDASRDGEEVKKRGRKKGV